MRKPRRIRRGNAAAAAVGGLFLIISPIMLFGGVGTPPLSSFFWNAANVSARLAVGDLLPSSEKPAQIEAFSEEAVPALAAVGRDNLSPFSVDDTNMLSRGALEMPSSANEEAYVPERSGDPGPEPYPDSLESRDGVITAVAYEKFSGESYVNLNGGGQIRNVTSLSNQIIFEESQKLPEFEVKAGGGPQILIMHTHTTESYEPYERNFFDASFTSRTTDESMSVVAVGNEITRQLENAGYEVIHDKTLHDHPSYNGSYDRSRETVKGMLEEYPSIKVVLDIHRDAMIKENGERIAPTAQINGRNAAQIMIISGCDDGTMNYPDYLQNLRFTSLLQQRLETDWEGLTRPVLFDYRKYNQDLTAGSILVEVGSHANSIEQAIYSGELVGKSLVNLFDGLEGESEGD